jgi:hypothetical protein
MGVTCPGDVSNAFGPLDFRMSVFTGSTVRPCTVAAAMEPYTSSLVLWAD